MNNLIRKGHDDIVTEMLVEFAKEIGVLEISNASDIAIKAKVYASQIEGLYYNQDFILKQSNPMTATGFFADLWAAALDVEPRKKATPSIGTLTFGRNEPHYEDLLIPKGSIASTNETTFGYLINAVTDEDAVLKEGELEVKVPATTLEKGTYTNVSSNSFNTMTTIPRAIDYVTNKKSFIDGSDEEDDESLRSRFKRDKFWGTEDAFANRAKEVEGVRFAKTLELNRGPGTADVLVTSPSGVPSDELLERVLEHLMIRRPIVCDLGVVKPELVSVDIDIELELESGYELTTIIDGVEMKERIKRLVNDYLLSAGIGGVVRVIAIKGLIYHIEGVKDVFLIKPSGNIRLKDKEVAEVGGFDVRIRN